MAVIIARLREPSTYAGVAGLLATFGISLSPGMVQNLTLLLTGLAGIVAALMPEGENGG